MASEQRLAILAYLANRSDASAADLAAAFGFSLPAAGMHLLRFTRSGLVHRTLDRREGRYFHSISSKGLARLRFLQRGSA